MTLDVIIMLTVALLLHPALGRFRALTKEVKHVSLLTSSGRGKEELIGMKRNLPLASMASLVAFVLSFTCAPAKAATTLRVATLVPQASSWGRILETWRKAVAEKTNNRVKLDLYYNAVQGMEDAMVAKMKTRQLDGAVVSSVGLADIYKNALALQLPGVLNTWDKLDRARNAVGPELEKGFASNGFSLTSWADLGVVHPFSTGYAVKTPSDIKSRRPLLFRDDVILPTVFQTLGSVVPRLLSVGEVLPALQTGSVDFLFAPGLAVEQLQWAQHLDHVTDWPMVCVIGGTVFRTEALDALPSDVRATFLEIQQRVGAAQTKMGRKDDESAYTRVAKKMVVQELDASNRDAWDKLAKEAVRKLSQSTFPRELVDKIVAYGK